jgi:hypothetical protein
MNARIRIALFSASLALVALLSCLNAPPPPASATLDGPPIFRPPVVAPDGGTSDAGARDGGPSDGGVTPPSDGGMSDGGTMGDIDAGPQGLAVISKMHKLPPPWVVTDPAQLNRLQALGSGSEGLKRVGQLVRFATPSTSDNTVATPEKCPNIFNNMCSGFAASAPDAGNPVLVDGFVLLGSASMDCAAKFNGMVLPSISGIWQGKFNMTSNETAYSIALTSCAGVGMGADYSGMQEAPASFDIQNMQSSYVADKRVVVVRGVVTAVANAATVRNIYIQDPVGGPLSGIGVRLAAGFMPPPAVGDYVRVTAKASNFGDTNQLLIEP